MLYNLSLFDLKANEATKMILLYISRTFNFLCPFTKKEVQNILSHYITLQIMK
jgi:hypothetical protein